MANRGLASGAIAGSFGCDLSRCRIAYSRSADGRRSGNQIGKETDEADAGYSHQQRSRFHADEAEDDLRDGRSPHDR